MINITEKKRLNLSPEVKKRMREAFDNPIGFRCWDCEKEITGLKIEEHKDQGHPVSSDGYIMMICSKCWCNEE